MKCKYEGYGVLEGRCMGTREVDPCPGYDKCKNFKPDFKTNADWMRGLNNKELAMVMATQLTDMHILATEEEYTEIRRQVHVMTAYRTILKWLLTQHEE